MHVSSCAEKGIPRSQHSCISDGPPKLTGLRAHRKRAEARICRFKGLSKIGTIFFTEYKLTVQVNSSPFKQ